MIIKHPTCYGVNGLDLEAPHDSEARESGVNAHKDLRRHLVSSQQAEPSTYVAVIAPII
jgi:hypothetical protein